MCKEMARGVKCACRQLKAAECALGVVEAMKMVVKSEVMSVDAVSKTRRV